MGIEKVNRLLRSLERERDKQAKASMEAWRHEASVTARIHEEIYGALDRIIKDDYD